MNAAAIALDTWESSVSLRVGLISMPTQQTDERTRVAIGTRRRVAGEELVRQLYAEHGRSVLAYATRLTGDRATAEDVVQETLVRAWKHADDLQNGTGSVRGWLLTVARNIITDRIRARAARPQEVTEVPADSAIATVESDHAQGVVDSMVVLGAMDDLSADHREVLVEIYYRGQTVTEASKTLGVAPGTVKSRSYYALRALKAAMSSKGTEAAR